LLNECWRPAFARYLIPKYLGRELARCLVESPHVNMDSPTDLDRREDLWPAVM
jgi:hypothetical protein